jgi:gliding motility-associated-like protein
MSTTWYFEGTNLDSFKGKNPPPVCYANPGKFAIRQHVVNSKGSDDTTHYITINPFPVADAGKDTAVCEGEPVQLHASGGVYYVWEGNPSPPGVTFHPLGSTYYHVRVTDTNGCSANDSVFVQVIPKPKTIENDTVICDGKSILLDAQNPGFSYHWNTGDTTPVLSVKSPGTYEVTISNKCFSLKSKYTVGFNDCSLSWSMPNSFSPNADLLNDVFKPVGVNIRDVQLRIYNRWGENIYEATGKDAGWDGRFNDKLCPVGLYLYTISVWGDDFQVGHRNGTMMLMR